MFEELLEKWENAVNEAILLEDEFENLAESNGSGWMEKWAELGDAVMHVFQISKRVLHADDDGEPQYTLTDAGREELERIEGRAS